MKIEVGIFAHNEERRIATCLSSLPLQDPQFSFHVLVNGSQDGTAEIAKTFEADAHNLVIHQLIEGDKARTWNKFVHDIADPADAFIFMDGDAEIQAGSLSAMAAMLKENPQMNIVCGLPRNGRHAETYRQVMRENRDLFGDLYAVQGDFIDRIRADGVSLPHGLIGEDSLAAAMAKTDLGTLSDWRNERIGICEEAGFYCESVKLTDPRHWILQYKRLISYSVRHFQNRMIQRVMKRMGPQGLPTGVTQLYTDNPDLMTLKWRGLNTYFDWLALRRMRAALKAASEGKDQS